MSNESVRSSQYLSISGAERLADAGVEPSVGSRGDAHDAALGSFMATEKKELIDSRRFGTRNPARLAPQWTAE